MEPAAYTLLGALGGILITQVANYFLEDKKSQNLVKLKKLDVAHHKDAEQNKERREIYAKYLVELDNYAGKNHDDFMQIINVFYSALIVANEATSKEITNTLSIVKKKDFESENYIKAKKDLLTAMRDEI